MQIKTEEGIAEPLPLSDIQTNNKLLESLLLEQKHKNLISMLWILIFILLMLYLKLNNVVNNIVSNCI
jgi:predicted nucleic acid-binding Zn ribbon protein